MTGMSTSSYVESAATKEGWLLKKGGHGMKTNWRRRWFVLDATKYQLSYFALPTDSEPLGIIDLHIYDYVTLPVKMSKFGLDERTMHQVYLSSSDESHKRVYQFRTDSQTTLTADIASELEAWKVAINAIILSAKQGNDAPDAVRHSTISNDVNIDVTNIPSEYILYATPSPVIAGCIPQEQLQSSIEDVTMTAKKLLELADQKKKETTLEMEALFPLIKNAVTIVTSCDLLIHSMKNSQSNHSSVGILKFAFAISFICGELYDGVDDVSNTISCMRRAMYYATMLVDAGDHRKKLVVTTPLAASLAKAGNLKESEQIYLDGIDLAKSKEGSTSTKEGALLFGLAWMYAADWYRFEDASLTIARARASYESVRDNPNADVASRKQVDIMLTKYFPELQSRMAKIVSSDFITKKSSSRSSIIDESSIDAPLTLGPNVSWFIGLSEI